MEKTSSVSQFAKAIKDFSKISFKVESLIDSGNADAVKIMNKSIENRKEAIAHEASRRLSSFDSDRKEKKEKEPSNTHETLENLILQEVEIEFDTGVEEEKLVLRGNSAEYKSIGEDTKEEDAKIEEEDSESSGSGSEESSEEESTDESTSTEEENSEEESTTEESSDETSDKDNSDDKSIKPVNSVQGNGKQNEKVDDTTK